MIYNKIFLVLSLLLTLKCANSFGLYGEVEQYDEPCGSCSIGEQLTCTDGICKCSYLGRASISDQAVITCKLTNRYLFKNKTCDPECPDDQFCEDGFCNCNLIANGTEVMIGDQCYQKTLQSPTESCYVNKTSKEAFLCDYEQFSFCKNNYCICYKKYYYNATSEACELRSELLESTGKKFESMPEGYCFTSSDCVPGLQCISNFTCACPSKCCYVREKGSCDCGTVQLNDPSSVVWCGIFVGAISIFFWAWLIKRTYREKTTKGLSPNAPSSYPLSAPRTFNYTPTMVAVPNPPPTNATATAPPQDLPPSYNDVVKDKEYAGWKPEVANSVQPVSTDSKIGSPYPTGGTTDSTADVPYPTTTTPYPISPTVTTTSMSDNTKSSVPDIDASSPVATGTFGSPANLFNTPIGPYPTSYSTDSTTTTPYPTSTGPTAGAYNVGFSSTDKPPT